MIEKGGVIRGRLLNVIVKSEDGTLSYLCNDTHADIERMLPGEYDEDLNRENTIIWGDEIDSSAYTTDSLDEAVAKLMYLGEFECYCDLIVKGQIYIAELQPEYIVENLITGSQMVDYWKTGE